ncbi:hypothetical protein W909_13700 [Dickeya zeae EC1]|nr:hypothetical protein W909_13700 [Dickeya zeae EC1]
MIQYRLVECQTQNEAEYTGAIFRPAQGRLFAQLALLAQGCTGTAED